MIVVDPCRVLMTMSELGSVFFQFWISNLVSGERHCALAVAPILALKYRCFARLFDRVG